MDSNIPYCTREDVKSALDVAETARRNPQVDRAIVAGARAVDRLCHRVFYPELRTMTFDWLNRQSPRYNRLWLDANELISITSATSGGVTLPNAQLMLRPDDGPPFTRLETDDSTSAAFTSGDTTQRAISITGWYGYRDDTTDAGALASSVDSALGTVDVTDGSLVGVGSLLLAGQERMLVTGRILITTGQTLGADLTDKSKSSTVQVANGSTFGVGELILIGGERMAIEDIAGNTLIVTRAVDGSVLAAHTTGATIYSPRRLVVQRGVVGTTAAAHNAGAITKWMPPPLVRQLNIAEAILTLSQEAGGYGMQIRAGESAMMMAQSIQDLRDQVYDEHGRKVRKRVVG
ncbi:hypothetical protein DMC63_01290 [Streptomyces sp. WAC 05977]|nr:hypothetical protein DMC63_01290 [Streptomyces sp. WAC 05977]